ncbi:hypothetical protein ACWF0M_01460 [Kribbella sp. NPDC055110]
MSDVPASRAAKEPPPGLRVLLIADSPPPEPSLDGESPALRHEAILALARAVFAARGTLIVPVDDDVALILATAALGYAQTPAAEGRSVAPPLIVMETVRPEPAAREELQPLVLRGAVSYRDPAGREVGLIEEAERERRFRHPVTTDLLQIAQPSFAVLLSPSLATSNEAPLLRGVETYLFRSTILDPDLRLDLADPTEWLYENRSGNRWSGPDGQSHGGIPYTFVMQRLVDQWIDGP